MGLFLPLFSSLLFISSLLSNPISIDRIATWAPDDIGILEQNAPVTMTPLIASNKLTCTDNGEDRCLLFPIGCQEGIDCTDRLEMRRINEGSDIGGIIISLNLHVPRTPHMLVAVPMPSISNANSTYLVGCSIDEAVAVVAKPDVDGVTVQLRESWLSLISVRATADDLECIVRASPGFVVLPEGDVAVFAGDLQEEEVRQSVRIGGSLDEDTVEDRNKTRERARGESNEQTISTIPHERRTQHSESSEPILVSVEDHRLSTTVNPEMSTVDKEQHKMHRHSSNKNMHSREEFAHDEIPSTRKTTVIEEEESIEFTTETPSTTTETVVEISTTVHSKHHHNHRKEESSTTVHSSHEHMHHGKESSATVHSSHEHMHHGKESSTIINSTPHQMRNLEESSTTVHSPHRHTHHVEESSTSVQGASHEHFPTEQSPRHSHERESVDREHHSVRMQRPATTATVKPANFEDDKELSEDDRQLLREITNGNMKEERRNDNEEEDKEEEESSSHHDRTHHSKHATVYELSREAAQDPIGRRPSEHSRLNTHGHSHELKAAVDEEDEHTTKMPIHTQKEKKEDEKGLHKNDERREKNHRRHSDEKEDEDEEEKEDDEDEDDASSSLSIIIPLIACFGHMIFDL